MEIHQSPVDSPCWPFVKGIHWSLMDSPYKRPQMQSFDVPFFANPNKLLKKQWCCWWFEMLWHSCDATLMGLTLVPPHLLISQLDLCLEHISLAQVSPTYSDQLGTHRADSMFAPSQWEMLLLCKNVSHWLDTNLESALNQQQCPPKGKLWFLHVAGLAVGKGRKHMGKHVTLQPISCPLGLQEDGEMYICQTTDTGNTLKT